MSEKFIDSAAHLIVNRDNISDWKQNKITVMIKHEATQYLNARQNMILMPETITAKDLNDEIQTWENEVIECLMLNKRQWYIQHRHILSWEKWYEALDIQYLQSVMLNLEEVCQTYSEAMLIFNTYTVDSSNDDMLS